MIRLKNQLIVGWRQDPSFNSERSELCLGPIEIFRGGGDGGGGG